MKTFFIILIAMTALCSTALAQETKPANKEVIVELPTDPIARPKVSLREALRKADDYIKKYKIDVSKYYMTGITMSMYGGENEKKIAVWQIGWVNERFAIGDYLTIYVSMEDGAVWQSFPSM